MVGLLEGFRSHAQTWSQCSHCCSPQSHTNTVPVFTLWLATSFFICSFVGLAGHLFFVVSDILNLFLCFSEVFCGLTWFYKLKEQGWARKEVRSRLRVDEGPSHTIYLCLGILSEVCVRRHVHLLSATRDSDPSTMTSLAWAVLKTALHRSHTTALECVIFIFASITHLVPCSAQVSHIG